MTTYRQTIPRVADAAALGFSKERSAHAWFSVLGLVDPGLPMLPDEAERGTGDYGVTLLWHGPHSIERARQFHAFLVEKNVPMLRGSSTYTPPYNGPRVNQALNSVRYHLVGAVEYANPNHRACFNPNDCSPPPAQKVETDEFVTVCPTYR